MGRGDGRKLGILGRVRTVRSAAGLRLRGRIASHEANGSNRRKVDEFAAESYSQEGEDMILRLLLDDRPEGFYVDVGAHHPRRYSNTAYFHDRGWRGINVDADPEAIALFEKERPGDINLNVGVSSEEGELEFTSYFERALNTFDPKQIEHLERTSSYEVSGTSIVEVKRLESILSQHFPAGRKIDFMSLDVEGLEAEVLRSNNWTRFRPDFVAVEIDIDSLADVARHPTYLFMVNQGYDCVAKTPRTSFFRERWAGRSK